MKGRSVLALMLLSLALACEGSKQPTGLTVPNDASKIISDAANGGNPDFFWLPPLVRLPLGYWHLGRFNNTLKPHLRIVICELNPDNLIAGRPSGGTTCHATVKTFERNSVQLVNLPLRQNGWWNLFHLPPDGFYYVLWDTRQAGLEVSKYYRIKVLLDPSDVPRGIADVDPISSLREWKYSLTGEVIQLVNGWMLPIPFRIENQGGLCLGTLQCTQVVVTNNSGTPDHVQVVKLGGAAGSIAAASFPDGWLPSTGPDHVTVTISEVPSAEATDGSRTRLTRCHEGLEDFQQFNGCFTFTTTPPLDPTVPYGDGHVQFAKDVTVAVCYVLDGTGDPREKFAELYSSGPNEPPHRLIRDVPDGTLLGGPRARVCETTLAFQRSSNPLVRLASSGWRTLKGGVGRLFGVETAYAIDLGLGGITRGFSTIGPVLPAHIEAYSATNVTLGLGMTTVTARVQIIGSHDHSEGGYVPSPINKVPVTFTVTSLNGGLRPVNTEANLTPQVIANTQTITVYDGAISTDVDGIASVEWILPTTPNTYEMKAKGAATGEVTFHVTVPAPISGRIDFETPALGGAVRQVINPYIDAATGVQFSADPQGGFTGVVGLAKNNTGGTSVCVAPPDDNQKLGTAPTGSTSIGLSGHPIRATFPTALPPGTPVSVEVQTGTADVGLPANVVRLRFLDASGSEVANITQNAEGPDRTCLGAPGNPRVRLVLSTVVGPAFKYLIIEVMPIGGIVFVIDNLEFGPQ